MMFFKFIRFDIKNGILRQYNAVLLTFLFSFLAAGLHALSLRVYELVHPEYLDIQSTIADFMITVFAGCRENAAQEMGMSFQVPFLWMAYICWMLLITLRYPLEELAGIGKQLLVLSRKRSYWFFSKCVWICIYTSVSFIAMGVGITAMGLLCGANLSFDVNEYLAAEVNFISPYLKPAPWNIASLVVPNLKTLLALGVVQFAVSLFLKPLYAYLLIVGYALACTYISSPFLVGNYMMGARSASITTAGYIPLEGIFISIWLAVVAAIIGWLRFSNYDILGKE